MSDVLILAPSNGPLPRRFRDFIKYAPTDMRITVKRMGSMVAGYSIDSVFVDDPLAELTGGQKDE